VFQAGKFQALVVGSHPEASSRKQASGGEPRQPVVLRHFSSALGRSYWLHELLIEPSFDGLPFLLSPSQLGVWGSLVHVVHMQGPAGRFLENAGRSVSNAAVDSI
jgi:hypothetical protein